MFRWMLTHEIPESEAIAILRDRIERPVAVILTGGTNRSREELIAKIACKIDCSTHTFADREELRKLTERFFARREFIIVDALPEAESEVGFPSQTACSLRGAGANTIVSIHFSPPDCERYSDSNDIDYQFRIWR